MNELIKLTQLPIIEERLQEISAKIVAETNEAMSLVCTVDTIQTVKKKRTELIKLYDELETQRKKVKAAITSPYDAFLKIYEQYVSYPFTKADKELKSKINEIETRIKEECEQRCKAYFNEYAASLGIDFLSYGQMPRLNISLTVAKKKVPTELYGDIRIFLDKIKRDLERIDAEIPEEERAEIMSEYKERLDVGEAIMKVQGRKRRIEAEKEAAEKRKAHEAETQTTAVSAPVITAPKLVKDADTEEEQLITISFTATATREKLIELRNYMIAEGIKYE